MAMTYDDLGDIHKAENYWVQAIKCAATPTQLHIHQRDYASFLFNNNQVQKGREFFEKAVSASPAATDDEVRYIADTYRIWAGLERNFDNEDEFDRLIKQA